MIFYMFPSKFVKDVMKFTGVYDIFEEKIVSRSQKRVPERAGEPAGTTGKTALMLKNTKRTEIWQKSEYNACHILVRV